MGPERSKDSQRNSSDEFRSNVVTSIRTHVIHFSVRNSQYALRSIWYSLYSNPAAKKEVWTYTRYITKVVDWFIRQYVRNKLILVTKSRSLKSNKKEKWFIQGKIPKIYNTNSRLNDSTINYKRNLFSDENRSLESNKNIWRTRTAEEKVIYIYITHDINVYTR